MGEKIQTAEGKRDGLYTRMGEPQVSSDADALMKLQEEIDTLNTEIDRMYARWQELEAKASMG